MVDQARRNGVRRNYAQSIGPPESEDVSTVSEPERVVIGRERLQRLSAAVAALPRRERATLLMYRLDGLSYAQIAKKMKISETTVRRCMAQALEKIHAWLGADGLLEK